MYFKKKFLIKVTNNKDLHFYEKHHTFHEGDSGVDLYITKDQTIEPGETVLVDLGIQCQSRSFDPCVWHWFTRGFYKYNSYILMPRSSISKTPLLMRNSFGLIDSGYTGNLKVPFYNTSSEPFEICKGERYVQLVQPDLSPVYFNLVKNHRKTSRGTGGFGSTNVTV
jgi:dUTP pyrophosphatase